MKKCIVCNIEKEEIRFNFRNKNKNIRYSHCKDCQKIKDKKLYDNSLTRKEDIRKRQKIQSIKLREIIINLKKSSSCVNCGESRFYVLDFHHKKDKKFDISQAPQKNVSINKLKSELNKCEILCSNCHREKHYLEGKITEMD